MGSLADAQWPGLGQAQLGPSFSHSHSQPHTTTMRHNPPHTSATDRLRVIRKPQMALTFKAKKQTPEQMVSPALDANPGHHDRLSERGPSCEILLADKLCGKTLALHQPALKSLNSPTCL